MADSQLRLIAPDPQRHGDAVVDLCAKTFSQRGFFLSRQIYSQSRILHSHYDWKTARIGFIGEHLATHWGVYDYQIWIGQAKVRCAGVGVVATHGDFRGRGLMRETALASIAAMKPAGYDVSFLTGIDNFYSKLGYVRSWPGETIRVRVADLPQTFKGKLKKVAPQTGPEYAALFNRQNAGLTAQAVHPTFPRWKWSEGIQGYSWHGAGGKLAGYFFVEKRAEMLAVLESAGDPEQLLAALAEFGKGLYSAVEFVYLHARSPIARRLRQGTCTVETHYRKDGHALMRCINLRSTLKKMSAELADRIAQSACADWSGKLLIENAEESVVLQIGGKKIAVLDGIAKTSHAIRGGDYVMQLIIGAHPPLETVELGKVRLNGDARRLVEALFPWQQPQQLPSDQV